MTLKAVVFDFDGTIVDSEPVHCKALQKILAPHGVALSREEYDRRCLGRDDRDIFVEFLGSKAPLDECVKKKSLAFAELAAEALPHAGFEEFLYALTQRQLRVAICSGAFRADIEAVLGAIFGGRYLKHFESWVTADEVPRSKPDPRCYSLICEKLALEAVQCLAIEDTAVGLKAACAAGLRTVGLTHSLPESTLAPWAERVVGGFDQILRSTWFGRL